MIVSAPGVVISVLLSVTYGLAFGLLVGKAGARLSLYVGAATLGFAAGYPAAVRLWPSFYVLGDVPVVSCTLTSLLAMTFLLLVRI